MHWAFADASFCHVDAVWAAGGVAEVHGQTSLLTRLDSLEKNALNIVKYFTEEEATDFQSVFRNSKCAYIVKNENGMHVKIEEYTRNADILIFS